MHSPFFGEFMGTLVLILLGNGVVANVVLKKTLGENSGWIVITTGWALAVMAGVFAAIACGSADAHINPAVTIGFAVSSGDFSKLATYIPAQMLGAIVGATLVWIHYMPHWSQTPDQGAKLACFCTGPGHQVDGVKRDQRSDRHVYAGAHHRLDLFEIRRSRRTGAGAGTVPGGRRRMGDRFVPGRHDGIRH